MSAKIIGALNSGEFRRQSEPFKTAVLETAFRAGLIAYDPVHDFFLDAKSGSILLGLLPDADGQWTVLQARKGETA